MTRIGKYEIQAELGRGGFGRVFRAYDPAVGRQVAIKVLTAEGDKSLSTRFRNEAAAAGKLRHKNIVTVYDFGEYKGTPFLVMEYLEGEDLHQIMSSGGAPTLLEKVGIMSQVAEGLYCAHQNGVIHRDVKPANIMVLRDGTVKIMDFGIARMLREDATRLTRKGDLIGTMLYMSPEQFTSSDVDALCDIFAYGVIYYELLTGKHPFRAADAAAMMYKITVEDPETVRRLAPECPQELEDMVHRAIQKDRDLRYQSMREIQLDAEPILITLQQERAAGLIAGAQALFDKQDLDAARRMVLEGLDLDPSNRIGRQLREALQKALQRTTLQPRIDALLNRAGEDLEARRFAEAIQNLEAALRLDRSNAAVLARLEDARAALERSRKAARLMADARREYQRGDLHASRDRVSEALREDASNPEAPVILKRLEDEIRVREDAKELKEGLAKASSLMAMHSFDEAVAALERLAAQHPQSEEAGHLLERSRAEKLESERRQRLRSGLAASADLLRERRFEEAVSALEAIGRDFPGEQEIADLMGYARRELQSQRRAEAIRALTRDVAERLERHDFDGAFGMVEEALKAYPGESAAVRLLRSIKTAQAEWERRQAIDGAIRRSGELAAALRFGEALEVLDGAAREYGAEAVREQRSRVEEQWARHRREEAIRAALGPARELLERGDFEGAIAAARAALEAYPGEPRLAAVVAEAEAAVRARREALAKIAHDARTLVEAKQFGRALELMEGQEELAALRDETIAARAAWEREQAIEGICREARESDLAHAAHLLRRGVREYRNDARLVALLEEAIARMKREARALVDAKEFGRAVELMEGQEELAALRQETIVAKATWEREQAIEGICREAREGELARAADLLRRGVREYRNDARLVAEMTRVAQALAEAKEFDRALELMEGQEELAALRQETIAARATWERERAIERICREAREGDLGRAADLLHRGVREYPNDARLVAEMTRVAQALVEAKEFGRALELMEGQEELADLRAETLAAKAAWERQQAIDRICREAREGNLGRAADLLRRGVREYPNDARLVAEMTRVAQALVEAKEFGRALQLMEGQEELAALHRETIAARASWERDQAIERICREAREGDLARAADLLRRGLREYPNDARLVAEMTRVAQALIDAKAFGRALELMEGQEELAALRGETIAARVSWERDQAIERICREARESDLARAAHLLRRGVREHQNDARLVSQFEETIAEMTRAARALIEAKEFDRALQLIEGQEELAALRDETIAARAAWERAQAIEAICRDARAAIDRGNLDAAVARLRAAVPQYENDQRLTSLLGEAERALRARHEEIAKIESDARRLLGAGAFDEALEAVQGGLARYPAQSSLEALQREISILRICEQARADIAAQDFEKAAETLRAGAALYRGEQRIDALLAELQSRRKAAAIAKVRDESAAFREAREFDRALQALDAGLKAWPGEPALREARELTLREKAADRAGAFRREGRYAEAVDVLKAALRQLGAVPALTALRGEVEEEWARERAVAALCEEAVKRSAAKDFDGALALLRDGLASHPGQSRLLELERAAAEAKAEWQRRRAREAANAARTLLGERRYEDAIARLEADMRECGAPGELAELLETAKRKRAAHSAAEDVAARAGTLAAARQYDEALRLLDEGLRSYPEEEGLARVREGVAKAKAAWDREQAILAAVRRAEALRAEGQLAEALLAADDALKALAPVPLLEALRRRLREEADRASRREGDLDRLRNLDRELRSNPDPGGTGDAARDCRQTAARWPGDADIESAAAAALAQAEAIEEAAGLFAREEYRQAADACRKRLGEYPAHAFFTRLEREAEERGRQKIDAFLAGLDTRLAAEPDLDRRMAILRESIQQYPDEPRLQVELRFHEARHRLVHSILDKARAHEEAGEYEEALEQWGALKSAYRQYPGVEDQIRRVAALRDHRLADAKSHWLRQVEQDLESGAFAHAEGLLRMARDEFPSDADLDALERKLKARADAARTLADAERLCSQRRYEEACQLFGLAHRAEGSSPAFRAHVLETLAGQATKAGADWRSAELLVRHARALDPRWAPPAALATAIDAGRRAESRAAGVAGQPLPQPAPTVLERRVPPPVPRRRLLPLFAAAAGVLVAAGAFFFWRAQRTEPNLVLEVSTTPDGALVQFGGKTCTTPNCRFDVTPGEYRLAFSKEGYESAVRSVVAERGKPESLRDLRVELVPLPQMLRISSNLASGTVWMNGKPTGRLQDGQMTLAAVPPGTHELKVASPEGEMELSFRTAPGEPPQVAAGPRTKDVKAVIATEFAGNVRVYCNCEGGKVSAGNGTPVAVAAGGAALGKLSEGVHELRITEGSGTRTIVLPVRAAPAMNVFLTSDRNVGTLVVEAGHPDARVLLNGRYRGAAAGGVLRVQVEPGTYEVKVEKQGYQPAPPQRVEVRKGEEARAPFRLVPVPQISALAVTGAAPGTQILLDGKPFGAASADGAFSAPVPPGEHVLEFVKGSGRRQVRRRFEAGATVPLGREQVAMAEAIVPQPPVLEPAPSRPSAPPIPSKPADIAEWERVSGSRNVADVAEFLRKFPDSRLAGEAARKMEQMEWDGARGGGKEQLRAFLNKYPNGAFARDASAELTKLERVEQAAIESRAVLDVIRRYGEAWKARDYDQLIALQPALRERKFGGQTLQKYLKDTVFLQYLLRPEGEPKIGGEEATVTCLRLVQQRMEGVTSQPNQGTVVFTLRKSGGQWRIQSDSGGR